MKPTTIQDFFKLLPGKLDADAAEDVDAVYQFDLSGLTQTAIKIRLHISKSFFS